MIAKEILGETFYLMSQGELTSNMVVVGFGVLIICIVYGWLFKHGANSYRKKKEYISKLTDKEYRHCDIVRRM